MQTAQMVENLPQNNLSIGEAARYLGVSIDTLRRWDYQGIIKSLRTAGNTRRFPKDELDRVKGVQKKPLNISEAAKELGVSVQTLRRWDREGKIDPIRNEQNERLFPYEEVEKFKKEGEVRSSIQKSPNLASIPPQNGGNFKTLFYKLLFFSLVLVLIFLFLYFLLPPALEPNLKKVGKEITKLFPQKPQVVNNNNYNTNNYNLAADLPIDEDGNLVINGVKVGSKLVIDKLGNINLPGQLQGGKIDSTTENLVQNSGFETPSAGAPAFWLYRADSTEINTTSTAQNSHTGTQSLRFAPRNDSQVLGVQNIYAPTKEGRTYTLSAFVKATDLPKTPTGTLRIGFSASPFKEGTYKDFNFSGSFDWLNISFTYFAAQEKQFPTFEVFGYGNGSLYVDDVQVEEGSTASVYKPTDLNSADGTILADSEARLYPAFPNSSLGTENSPWDSVYGKNLTAAGNILQIGTGKQLKLSTASSDPSRGLGSGALYYNTNTARVRVFDATTQNWSDLQGSGGSGTITVQEGDSDVDTAVTTIDFLGADFDITSSPAGEANVALSSAVAHVNAAETITAAWTIGTGGSLSASGTGTITATDVSCSTCITLTSEVTGTLPIANGGTNATTVGSAGSIAYSSGTAYAFSAVGSSGQCLQSGGTGTPTWATCVSGTLFTAAGTSGTNQTISQGDTLTIGASTGITTTGAATDTVNVAVDQSTAFAWTGNHTQTTTITDDGTQFLHSLTLGNDAGVDTINAVRVAITSAATGDADIIYGVNLDDVTSADSTVTETALRIGASYDNAIEFEGATADGFEIFLRAADATADRVFTFPDVADGNICISAVSCTATGVSSGTTLFTLAGDTGTNQTISQSDTLTIAGGTNGIDTVGGATDTVTLNLDTTEIGTTTFGTGSGIVWTFDVGATDPTLTFATGALTIGSAAVTISGSADGTDALTLTAGDILVSDGDLDLSGGDFNVTLDAADSANITNAGSSTNLAGGLKIAFTGSAAGAVTQYGLSATVTESTATTTDITHETYGAYLNNSRTSLDTATGHTVNVYGTASVASNTQASGTGTGTRNTYGGYFSATGDTEGTHFAYGVYATAAGGDTNYGLYVGGGNTYLGTTAYGASLSDCDTAASSKLLWSDTGVFSCGTDGVAAGTALFTLDGDDADTQGITAGDTLLIAGGTNGIDTDVSATDTITLNLDTTEIGTTTFGSGSAITWTFDASAGTDTTIAFGDGSISPTLSATGLFNVLTGNLKVGNGTPGVSLDGEDAYIEGTFEVDGTSQFDGNVTLTGGVSFTMSSGTGTASQTYAPAGTTAAATAHTITPTFGIDATDQTLTGLIIAPNTNSNTDAGDTLYGVDLSNITATAATETAIRIGSAYDNLFELEGATNDGFEIFLRAADATADRVFTFPDVADGNICISAVSCTATGVSSGISLFTLDGDDADTQGIASGDTLLVAGGTNGIDTDVSATDTITLNLDTTEIGTTTFGSGSAITWTFDAGATDPTIAFASAQITLTGSLTATLAAGEKVLVDGATTANTGTAGVLDINATSLTHQNSGVNLSYTSTAAGAAATVTQYGIFSSFANTQAVTATSPTFNLYGAYGNIAKSGADSLTTDGTFNTYGTYVTAANTSTDASAAGTRNTYGGYFAATGAAAGTTTAYGIYVTAASADTNYGLYVGGGNSYVGTTLYGASLSDCDTAASSKLLWSDTGVFSCGTDTGSGTLFTLDGDDADTQVIAQGDTLLVAGGTNGIDTDVSATDTVTLNLDYTEIAAATFGTGSGFTWTFDAGATDPALTFGSNALTIASAATITATDVTAFNCTDCIDFDDLEDTLDLDAALTLNQGTNTWTQNFTGTTTTGFTYNADSATTGTGILVSADGLTTGNALNIASTSTAGGASGTSYVANLSRSGANANLAHTAYGLASSVTNTNATSGTNIAGYFTATGATTANYALYIPDQTDATGPNYGLYVAGADNFAIFTAADDVNFDLGAADSVIIDGSTVASTQTIGVLDINVTSVTDKVSGINLSFSSTSTASANDQYGLYSTFSNGQNLSGSGTARLYGQYSSTTKSGVDSADATVNLYGIYSYAQNTSTGNTGRNTFGGFFGGAGNASNLAGVAYGIWAEAFYASTGYGIFVFGGASTNNYGIFVADQTGGVSTDYGVYIAGADNYAIYTAADDIQFTLGADDKVLIDGSTTASTGTAGVLDINVTTSTGNHTALNISTTNTAASGNTSYGIYNTWSSSTAITDGSPQTTYGLYTTITKTGADVANTTNMYGTYSTASNTGADNTIDSKRTFGGYFAATGDTSAIATAYGVYATASGADNNFIYYMGAAPRSNATAGLCWDNSGASDISDCNGTPADLAENYGTNDQTIEAGDVVALAGEASTILDPHEGKPTSKAFVGKSSQPYQSNLIGVISTNPSLVFADDGVFSPEENPRPVSLSGRAPVKVTDENGPIRPGDPITSSSTAGVGMRATEPGRVVGIALSSYENPDPGAVGQIIVFVNPGWYLGLAVTGDGSLAGSQQTTDNSQQTTEESQTGDAGIQEPEVSAGSDQPLTRSETESLVRELIAEHEATDSAGQQTTNNSQLTTATNSASPTIDEFLIKVPDYLTSVQKVVLQTLEATLVSVNKLVAVVIESLPGQNLAIKLQPDPATGQSGTLQVTDGNSTPVVNIDAGGNLEASGSALVNKLNLRKETTSVGTGTLLSGTSLTVINTTSVTTDSLIFVTATSPTDKTLAVTNKIAGSGFTVEIKTPAEADINFNWWVVN